MKNGTQGIHGVLFKVGATFNKACALPLFLAALKLKLYLTQSLEHKLKGQNLAIFKLNLNLKN